MKRNSLFCFWRQLSSEHWEMPILYLCVFSEQQTRDIAATDASITAATIVDNFRPKFVLFWIIISKILLRIKLHIYINYIPIIYSTGSLSLDFRLRLITKLCAYRPDRTKACFAPSIRFTENVPLTAHGDIPLRPSQCNCIFRFMTVVTTTSSYAS